MIWIYDRHRDGTMVGRMDCYMAGALGARDEMRCDESKERSRERIGDETNISSNSGGSLLESCHDHIAKGTKYKRVNELIEFLTNILFLFLAYIKEL